MVLTRLLTASEVAHILHVHINTIRRGTNQGELKGFRIGSRGDRRYQESDVETFLLEGMTPRKDVEVCDECFRSRGLYPLPAQEQGTAASLYGCRWCGWKGRPATITYSGKAPRASQVRRARAQGWK